MNRTALAIEMLQLLRVRRTYVPLAEIAGLLESSVRNVRELKKELEIAGYFIESKRGLSGGYCLKDEAMIPATQLTELEKQALTMADRYLSRQLDFLYYPSFMKAMGKVVSSVQVAEAPDYLYARSMLPKGSEEVGNMVQQLQQAIAACCEIQLSYASLQSRIFRDICVQPYDVVSMNGFYYVIAFSLERLEYRNYKISAERMQAVCLTQKTFAKDLQYRRSDHIGVKSIVKGEHQRVTLRVQKALAVYIAEHEIGIDAIQEWEDNTMLFTTSFENETVCDSFILSLGTDAQVISPQSVKLRIQHKLQKMQTQYML